MKIHTGVVIGKTCWRCGKRIVQYYNILCMDCADELGISEIFKPTKEEVRERVKEDLKNAVEIDGDRIFLKWFPMFFSFPNIRLETLFKVMGV